MISWAYSARPLGMYMLKKRSVIICVICVICVLSIMDNWDLVLPAYAKINLGLRVLGKRPDGFHAIQTIFQEVEFHDTLYFTKQTPEFSLTTNHASLPSGKQNLIWQAVQLLRKETGCSTPAAIHLDKHIPLGAGLGGGSSDAAAALQGLNALFELQLSQRCLAELGAQLGSDVAFFLYGGTAVASGRGEQVQPLADIEPVWVVLVNPGIHVSSAWAYKNLNLKLTNFRPLISVLSKFEEGHVAGIKQLFSENMLEKPVIREYPVIQEIKNTLQAQGAEWTLMSGSGSTVFGIFTEKAAAEYARQCVEQPGWLVVLTRTKQRTTTFGLVV